MTSHTSKQDKNKMCEIDESITRIFDIRRRLGKGAYGIVWKAMNKRTNVTVAVKKIFDAFRDETDAQRTFREVMFLKAFHTHPNIVQLLNVYKATNNLDIYLVFEFMESDLHNIIKKGTVLKDVHKRYVMYQLINAIRYIHSGNVIHRDLKPSNVLIDNKCRCKLADFGLARSLAKPNAGRDDVRNNDSMNEGPLLTDYVATRWYRAPEILVASKKYTKGIDMWSLGCILAEMLRGKPLFQGESTVNQIEKIVNAMPEITDSDVSAVGGGFGATLLNKQISSESSTSLDVILEGAPYDALDLTKSLIVLDPSARLTATECLNHVYVNRFRHSTTEEELNIDVVPPFRDDVRMTVPQYRTKLYEIVQPIYGDRSRPVTPIKNRNVGSTVSFDLRQVVRTKSFRQTSKAPPPAENNRVEMLEREPELVHVDRHENVVAHHNHRNHVKPLKMPTKKSSGIDLPLKSRSHSRIHSTKIDAVKEAQSQQLQYQYQVDQLKQQQKQHNSKLHQTPHHHHHYIDSTQQQQMQPPAPIIQYNQKPLYVADERLSIVVPRSKQLAKPRAVCSEDSLRTINLEKRNSLDGGYLQDCGQVVAVAPPTPQAPAQPKHHEHQSSRRYSSTTSLQRQHGSHTNIQQSIPNLRQSPALSRSRSNSMLTIQMSANVSVRKKRSDSQITKDKASSGRKSSVERVCFKERLDDLETEIEKYKEDVKIFCREKQRSSRMLDEPVALQHHPGLRKKSSSRSLAIKPPMPATEAPMQYKTSDSMPALTNGNGHGHASGRIHRSGYGRANGKITASGYGGEPNRRSTADYKVTPYMSSSNSSLDNQKSEGDLPTFVSSGGSGDHLPQPKISQYQYKQEQQQQQLLQQQQSRQSQYRSKPLSKFLKKTQEAGARHHTYLKKQTANAR